MAQEAEDSDKVAQNSLTRDTMSTYSTSSQTLQLGLGRPKEERLDEEVEIFLKR